MSTSDRTLVSTAAPGSEGVIPGVLSPAELSRMANELFSALPDELQQPAVTAARVLLPPNSAFTGNPYAAAPSPTAPAVPGILAGLTEVQPGAFVATPDRSIVPDTRSSASAAPAVPGGGIAPAVAPEFGFLQDARPIFQEPATEPATQRTPAQANGKPVPSEDGYASIPFSLPADFQPAQIASFPTPTVPGSLGVVDSSAVPTFSFIEDARPLFSNSPTIPRPVPAAGSTDNSASYGNPFASPLDRNTPQLPGTVTHEPDFRAPASHDPERQSRPLDATNVLPVIVPGSTQPELLGDLGLSSYSFDVETIRRDFPILREQINGHPLIWFDNGATTQKPQSVIDRLSYFYEHENSNVHRAAHELAARSTDAYESAREKTRRFLNAGAPREIVFVRGATEAINLVAQSWGRRNIQKDDEIVVTCWSITPISFPGRCFARKRARGCVLRQSMSLVRCCSMSTRGCWDQRQSWFQSRTSRMRWVRLCR